MDYARKTIETNGLSLALVDEGTGPAVVLLHGFPESADVWRNQIPFLVDAGFRVIAPDLRGFGESDRPSDTAAYAIEHLLADITGMLELLEVDRTHVVGHDWGAGLSWLLAAFFPDRVDHHVAMSVGHPLARLETTMGQWEKSWYVFLFQFEGVAEKLLSHDDWRLFREFVRNHSEADKWIQDLERPGALRAALNWYRANLSPERLIEPPPEVSSVKAPTLGVWADGDAYLEEAQMLRSENFVDGVWQYERIEGSTHWPQLDQPERLNRLLADFLSD